MPHHPIHSIFIYLFSSIFHFSFVIRSLLTASLCPLGNSSLPRFFPHPPPIHFCRGAVTGNTSDHQPTTPTDSIHCTPATPVKPAVEKAPNEGSRLCVHTAHPLYLCAAARLRTSWFLLRINRTDLKPSVSHLGLAHQTAQGSTHTQQHNLPPSPSTQPPRNHCSPALTPCPLHPPQNLPNRH